MIDIIDQLLIDSFVSKTHRN